MNAKIALYFYRSRRPFKDRLFQLVYKIVTSLEWQKLAVERQLLSCFHFWSGSPHFPNLKGNVRKKIMPCFINFRQEFNSPVLANDKKSKWDWVFFPVLLFFFKTFIKSKFLFTYNSNLTEDQWTIIFFMENLETFFKFGWRNVFHLRLMHVWYSW